MPIWFDAIGVFGIGFFTGYMFTFGFRRLLPPVNMSARIGAFQLIVLLASVGVTGTIGIQSATLPQGSMIGPYGFGLLSGLVSNTVVVLWAEVQRKDSSNN